LWLACRLQDATGDSPLFCACVLGLNGIAELLMVRLCPRCFLSA
jgi:hypothetical protein